MPELPKRTLGRTGLQVTVLGFGALELCGMVAGVGRPLSPGQPERILHAVLDAASTILMLPSTTARPKRISAGASPTVVTSPTTHTTLVGTLSPEHLQENVAAVLQGPLPAAVYNETKRRLDAVRKVPE